MTCRPGHPARHPDFGPGNLERLVHGAQSPRVLEAVGRVIRDEVTSQAPWLVEPIFADALVRYCRAEARARLLTDHIFKVCEEQSPGKIPVRLWESASGADNAANKAAEALGLTPIARARLAALATSAEASFADLQALADRGAALRKARQAALRTGDDQ